MSSPLVTLFATTIFASAFLIFFVQPMVGKHILPWFGGAPAVWSLCLVFYQLTLFAGYVYAHLLIRRVRGSRQLLIHALLFAATLAVLPVLPDESWKPEGGAPPMGQIFSMLAANVGLPFLLLAATGPLLQAWYARVFPGRSPYGLYAVSNLGSLLALVSYPFVVEPRMPLSLESQLWSWLFAGCGLAILCCAWLASRGNAGDIPPTHERAADANIDAGQIALWVLLPACAVVLFMGVTNELCVDLASAPFLWIAPLAIYLLTYILCFSSERLYRRGLFAPLAAFAVGYLIWSRVATVGPIVAEVPSATLPVLAVSFGLALFLGCMLIHGELYRLRPAPARLTAYYLCISGGGALGGLFVGIAAPQVFSGYYELPFGWAACWVLFTWTCLRDPGPLLRRRSVRTALVVTVAGVVVTLGMLTARDSRPDTDHLLYQKRNFFSILRVTELRGKDKTPRMHRLKSGTTVHGAQPLHPKFQLQPTTYYGSDTGIGFVMAQREAAPMHVGVIGLGIGTLAAYGRAGDHYQFYEIDPDVIRIAEDEGYFSYLANSPAQVELIPGDGRLSLESQLHESGPQRFDLLVLDAFSSDAIPVHLLTVEAFKLYTQHLKPDGVLAVHITNRHLNLAPLVFGLAAEFEMRAAVISNPKSVRHFQQSASWVILSKNASYLDSLLLRVQEAEARRDLQPLGIAFGFPAEERVIDAPLWTDDYSDLFSVLRSRKLSRFWSVPERDNKRSKQKSSRPSAGEEGG
jgi:hypothetical protein